MGHYFAGFDLKSASPTIYMEKTIRNITVSCLCDICLVAANSILENTWMRLPLATLHSTLSANVS